MVTELPSFLITFREALEATLIVAIILAYLKKIGKEVVTKCVWLGTILAIVVSLTIGNGLYFLYGGLSGVASEAFEALASLGAVVILTYMVFWMAKNSTKIKGELEEKVDLSLTKGQLLGISALAFVAVFREGVETVLFLTPLVISDIGGTLIGIAVGTITIGLLGMLMLKGSVRLPIRSFFKYTSVLLVIFSAGLLATGVHELMEIAKDSGSELGVLTQVAFNVNPGDVTNLLHEKGIIGSILKALVGYDGNPEWAQVIAYLGYWFVIGPYLVRTYVPSLSVRMQNYIGLRRTNEKKETPFS
jgi:high-affinity iron transporter